MSVNEALAQKAASIFPDFLKQYDAIEVLSLATTDGFPVYNECTQKLKLDTGKMAAASSTLYSISNAVAQQILSKSFKITIIEAEQGNIAFVAITLNERDFVIAMSVNQTMNVGQLRVIINRVADSLASDF